MIAYDNLSLSKRRFDKLVDGGVSPPPLPPFQSPLKS